MQSENIIPLLKAVADPVRLRILKTLLNGPQCLEALTERLGLAPSTVSFHLKKLVTADLVFKVREQYYTLFTLNGDLLNTTLKDLVLTAPGAELQETNRLAREQQKVIDTFFENGRLRQLPVQQRKRDMVLDVFLSDFESGRSYQEAEVNSIISQRFDDHCTIRRLLVDRMNMTRQKGRYRLADEDKGAALGKTVSTAPKVKKEKAVMNTSKDQRKAAIAAYKTRPKEAGIWKITCTANDRFLLGGSTDMHAPFNRHRAMLNLGSHRIKELQDDWRAHGADSFTFEILESIPDKGKTQIEFQAVFEEMQAKWIEALSPFKELMYNPGGRLTW